MTENGPADRDVEVPEADAAEQAAELVERDDDRVDTVDRPLEVDVADRAEQARAVPVEEDEYR